MAKLSWKQAVKKYGIVGAKSKGYGLGGSKAKAPAKRKKAVAKAPVKRKAVAKKSKGRVLGAWQKFVKANKGSGKTLKQLAVMYKKGSKASSKRVAKPVSAKAKPSKSKGKLKRLTASNCEAVKTHTVTKGYSMSARKRKAGKKRTSAY